MLQLKDYDDGVVFGGDTGGGVEFIDCVHEPSTNDASFGRIKFRVKVSSKLTGRSKDPTSTDDYTIIDEDLVDILEWVPSQNGGNPALYPASLSRFNKKLAFLSGVEVDPTDEEAWMRAVTEDGDINQGILKNVVNVYVVKKTNKKGYPEVSFVEDSTLPKKPTLEEFKKQFLAKRSFF